MKKIIGVLILFNILPVCLGALAMSVGFTFLEGWLEGCKIMFVLMLIVAVALYGVHLVKSE